jgi:hypothetical protein
MAWKYLGFWGVGVGWGWEGGGWNAGWAPGRSRRRQASRRRERQLHAAQAHRQHAPTLPSAHPPPHLRVASSFMMCALPLAFITWEIFSRAERSWMPTLVTPIGQGLLPMASFRYTSLAAR